MSKRRTKAETYAIISEQLFNGQTLRAIVNQKKIYQTYKSWLRRFKNESDFPKRSKKKISSKFTPVEIETVSST